MNYDSILIITYRRSGSTLLQGILNSIDGCLIRGENGNLCFGFYQAYKFIIKAKSMQFSPTTLNTPRHAWFGNTDLNQDEFLLQTKKIVKQQLFRKLYKDKNISRHGFNGVVSKIGILFGRPYTAAEEENTMAWQL